MASINFIYRSKKDFAPLILRLLHKNEIDLFINTNYNCKRSFWFDSKNKKQLKYPKTNCKEALEVKSTIIKLEEHIFNKFNQDYNVIRIDKNWLQECIDIYFNRVSYQKQKTKELFPSNLTEYISHYIEKAPTIKNSKGGFGLSKSRIDDFKTLRRFLKEFQGKKKIKIIDVNLNFSNEFLSWMIDDKKYASGYAGRMLSAIKTICNDASFNGLETHPQLVKVTGYKTKNKHIIVLTPDEIELIKNTHFKLKSLKNAKKWLLFGCYTGQRVSDLLNITSNNIHMRNNLEVIEIKQQKTGKQVTIPLLNETKEIISDGFPHKISQQKFNDYIKDVCRISGIDTITEGMLFNKDSKRREYGLYKKWQLVSSHICRRSFCTNNFGTLPNYLIMSVTGHSSEKTFLGYIGKTSYDYAKQFKELYYKNQS